MKRSTIFTIVISLAGCAVLAGCPDNIYTGGETAITPISPKSAWRVYGDLKDAQRTIDGDVGTFAVSADSYENAKLTIDLGKPCVFNTIALDHGTNQNGYCRRMSVGISYDGKSFTQVYSCPGTKRITYISLITPTLARFIRIQAVVPGDRPWAIAEVYLQ
jgi:hypothetical protein